MKEQNNNSNPESTDKSGEEKIYVHKEHQLISERFSQAEKYEKICSIQDLKEMSGLSLDLTKKYLAQSDIKLYSLSNRIYVMRVDAEKFAITVQEQIAKAEKEKIEKDLKKEQAKIDREKAREKKMVEREANRIKKEKERQAKLKLAEEKRIEREKKRAENEKKRTEKMRATEKKRFVQLKELAEKYKDNKEYSDLFDNFVKTAKYIDKNGEYLKS